MNTFHRRRAQRVRWPRGSEIVMACLFGAGFYLCVYLAIEELVR